MKQPTYYLKTGFNDTVSILETSLGARKTNDVFDAPNTRRLPSRYTMYFLGGCPKIHRVDVLYYNSYAIGGTLPEKGCKFESPPIGEVKNFFISDLTW